MFGTPSITSAIVIQCLRRTFTRFELPQTIVSDNVSNLMSTESSKAVLALWKDIFMLKLDDKGIVDTEGFVQSVIESNRMCRRCFSAFDRLKKLKKTVEDNANKAIDALIPSLTRKRQV